MHCTGERLGSGRACYAVPRRSCTTLLHTTCSLLFCYTRTHDLLTSLRLPHLLRTVRHAVLLPPRHCGLRRTRKPQFLWFALRTTPSRRARAAVRVLTVLRALLMVAPARGAPSVRRTLSPRSRAGITYARSLPARAARSTCILRAPPSRCAFSHGVPCSYCALRI